MAVLMEKNMKNVFVLLGLVVISMIPLQSHAAGGYYYTVLKQGGGTFGPFQSLSDCQEALAKMQGKFPSMRTTGCFHK